MKVHIVCYEDVHGWILGKFALKLQEHLCPLGVAATISKQPDPQADINHHIIYFDYDGRKTTTETVMVTHIDTDWKRDRLRLQLVNAAMGICMSAETVDNLAAAGLPREKLCFVNPGHDGEMRARRTVIGITSKVQPSGCKREGILLDLAKRLSPDEFQFRIMGTGWEGQVQQLRLAGFKVEYWAAFSREEYLKLMPSLDYYLYLGLDEGSMGFMDALAAGVQTIVTTQGYHLDAPGGITHGWSDPAELFRIFEGIAHDKRLRQQAVANWTWPEYAKRHFALWQYLLAKDARQPIPAALRAPLNKMAVLARQMTFAESDRAAMDRTSESPDNSVLGGQAYNRPTSEAQASLPAMPPASSPPPPTRELRIPSALADPILDRHGVHPWFKHTLRDRADRWESWQSCFWLAEQIAKDLPVLDLACGVGFNLFWLGEQGFRALDGQDLAPEHIAAATEIARQTGSPARFWTDNALHPDRPFDCQYGAILALNFTHCAQGNFSLGQFLTTYELHLRPGGVLIFDAIDPSYSQVPDNQFHTADAALPPGQRRPSEYINRLGRSDVESACAAHGFCICHTVTQPQRVPKIVYFLRRLAKPTAGAASNSLTQVTRNGVTFALDITESIDRSLHDQGCFEQTTTAVLAQLARPGMTVLDIGANIGAHALYLAKHVGPTGRVLAFEPMSGAISKLRRSAGLNPALTNLTLHHMALGEENGTLTADFNHSWPVDGNYRDVMPEPVPVRRLDDFLREQGIPRVDLIKLDVDGFEHKILRGAAWTLRESRPLLVMELCNYTLERVGDSVAAMLADLAAAGYQFFFEHLLEAPAVSEADLLKAIPVGSSINIVAVPISVVARTESVARAALATNPNDRDALTALVSVCLDSGRWGEAAGACRQILHQAPDDVAVLSALAHCLGETGDDSGSADVNKRVEELTSGKLNKGFPTAVEVDSSTRVGPDVAAVSVSRRPRILLIADVPNWIFERHARTLLALLGDKFEFTLCFQGQPFNEDDYDLIYPFEWNLVASELIRHPSKWITGIRSHCSWDKEPFAAFAERLCCDFQRVHVVSQRLLGIFAPHVPGVVCVSHGVDTQHFAPTTRADQSGCKLRLGWAGNRLSPNKGFKEIIEPLGRLPGVELVFCGYSDRNLSLDQMKEFYNSIDAYVCASDFEGNNNSLLEAAAMARAIVTTDNGTVSEYLRHGESALIVGRSLPAFSEAVERLRDTPPLRRELGAAARASVVAQWDWRTKAEDYRALFSDALIGAGFSQSAAGMESGSTVGTVAAASPAEHPGEFPTEIAAELKKATAALEQGNLLAACAIYHSVFKAHPDDDRLRDLAALATFEARASYPVPDLSSQVKPARLNLAILTFNALDYTKLCLASLKQHTNEPYNVFIVDNGSTDGTREWFAEQTDANLFVEFSPVNLGVPGGRNRLVQLIQPHLAVDGFVVFVDNDIEMLQGWSQRFLELFDRHPEIGIAGKIGHDILVHVESRDLLPSPAAIPTSVDVASGGFACWVRAATIKAVGLFDEKLGLFWHEDDDYCVRAIAAGWEVYGVPLAPVIHHEHQSGAATPDAVARGGGEANQRYLVQKWRQLGYVDASGRIVHPARKTLSVPQPRTRQTKTDKDVVIGIDGRTFYLTDSTSRGIGHYAFNHLKNTAQLRPDWRFVIYIEEDRFCRAIERLLTLPNVGVKLLDTYCPGEVDLFHIPDPMNLASGFDSPVRLCPGVPNSAIFYDLTPLRYYWENMPEANRKAYLARLDQFQKRGTTMLAISEFTRQDLLKATKTPIGKIVSIMAGLNQAEKTTEITRALVKEVRTKYGITRPFFLHVGALDPHKNFETAITAISRIRSKDGIQLVVVGEKEHYLKSIADHCAKLKAKYILFPGYIPRLDLEVLYHEAVALLFLSRYEGFGFPVLEAMAQGCPVITTNVTSIPEVAGDAALLFAPDDHAAITQGMQQLLDDRKLRATLSAKGRVQAAKFPWTKPAQKTIEVWERLLGVAATGVDVEPAENGCERTELESPEQRPPCAALPGNAERKSDLIVGTFQPAAPADAANKVRAAVPKESSPTQISSRTLTVGRNVCSVAPVAPLAGLPGLVWFAHWRNSSGYSSEALAFAQALAPALPLQLLDVAAVKSQAFVDGLPTAVQKLLRDHLRSSVDPSGRICLVHSPGSSFEPLPTAAWSIGRTMFETDRLPESWVTRCNQMDEIWVPSRFNLETFAQSGVEVDKLYVIPGAVDPDQFDPVRHSPLPLPSRAAFNFLAVFEWTFRKGWDVLLAAYLREFSAADDVCLYLRTYLVGQPDGDPAETVWQLIREHAANLNLGSKSWPRIEILAQQIPSADLPRLYRAVDCLVAPSRGEGWGRPHHEAMLMELPVIATNWSGNTEFMTVDNSLPLEFQLVDVKVGSELRHYQGHRWAEPSETHLRELMRRVQRDPANAREIGRRARASLGERFSPAAVAQRIRERLCAIQQRLTTPALTAITARTHPSIEAGLETNRPADTGRRAAITVAWEGSFLDYGSLSHVNREFTRQLGSKSGLQLTCVSPKGLPNHGAAFAGRREIGNQIKHQAPHETQVTIRHSWPPKWTVPESGAWVHIQPWEFGVLPVEWVTQLEKVDEVWAYSEYVRRVYVDSGVPPTKVKVVPLGIDPQQFHPDVAPMGLATAKSFKFLFVGGTIGRKGPDLLLQSFLGIFTAADDVCLVIKDFGGKGAYTGQTMAEQIIAAQATPGAPEILYLDQEWTSDVMPSLYTACDCLVHPYRGEGFGLPVIEAMACGLPVIVTGGGATDDFAPDEYAYRISACRRALGLEIGKHKLVKRGWWLEPDVPALASQMRWILEHHEQARAKGLAASKYVRREWTWERAASIAEGHLHALAARQSATIPSGRTATARKAAPIILPPVAQVGQLTKAQELFRRKSPRAAWESTREAIRARPFHPEAFLLLAEIARMVGDSASARSCAQHALALAPGFKPARKFLQGKFNGNTQPAWLVLPPEIENRKTKTKSRLSVCLIVKNEERFIGQCLASVKGVADQIVVVDTGSTDRTVEIAKEHGAEVHAFAWCDDFSAARNAALEHVTGDWVLALDADEELPPGQHEALRQMLEPAEVMAWRLPLQNIGHEAEGCSYVPRLFRNAPSLFFFGRVHEQVSYSVEVRCKQWGLANRLGTAMLRHHGYTEETMLERGKVERNLRLIEQAIKEIPDDPGLFMQYGLELTRSHRVEEGLRQYQTAFEIMSELPASAVVGEFREGLLTQYCTQLLKAKGPAAVVPVLSSPLARNGDLTASLHYMMGLGQIELQQFSAAAEQMRHCLAKRGLPALTPVNPEIRKVTPRHWLALCLWQAKDTAGAEGEFQTAIAEAPELVKLRTDYAKFLHEHGKTADALQLLNQFTSTNPAVVEGWATGGQIALSQPGLLEVALDWTAVAFNHHPEDAAVLEQRAEALMLSGHLQDALPLLVKVGGDAKPRAMAARILCETALGVEADAPAAAVAEEVSQEFVHWYWRLVEYGAESAVLQLHANVGMLERVLPDAARVAQSIIAKLAEVETV